MFSRIIMLVCATLIAVSMFVDTEAGKQLVHHWTGEQPAHWGEKLGWWLRAAILGKDA
jgi:hypothetical protein